MPVKAYKPTTPSRRSMTVSDFSEITSVKPEKSLMTDLRKSGGRNHRGKVTTRHHGGGVKRAYRIIDFKRDKQGVPARVATIGIRSEPLGAHRSVALCGWRKALHSRSPRVAGGR